MKKLFAMPTILRPARPARKSEAGVMSSLATSAGLCFTAPPDGTAQAPVHRDRGPDRRRKDDAGARAVQALPRPRALRDRGGEPVPGQLLPGPPEVRLPDPALLPALPLQAAAGPVPAGPVQQRDHLGLPLREGPDLRVDHARLQRAGPLRARLRAPGAARVEAGPGHLPAGPAGRPARAHQEARP